MESADSLYLFAALIIFVGLFAGVLAGLLGVGGGIVIVPALYHVFSYLDIDGGLRMHLAVGTSLATIIPTSLRSVHGHWKKGAVDLRLLAKWGGALFGGVVIGTWIAGMTSDTGLTLVFGIVALFVALHMALGNTEWSLGDTVPGGATGQLIPAVIGIFSALMGIGGGTLSVPILTLYNVKIHRAVATSAGFGLIIAVPATVGFVLSGWHNEDLPAYSFGYVNLLAFALIVPAAFLSVPLGVKTAHWLPGARLRKAFALFLGLTSVRMIWDSAAAYWP